VYAIIPTKKIETTNSVFFGTKMSSQDWSSVVLRNPNATIKTSQTSLAKPAASGRVSDAVHAARKVENSETMKLKMLSTKSRSELAQARTAKGFTQKQLDQRCQFPVNTTNSWESGKSCPTGPQINILHRILGIKLERD
jgi:ribosome-binding protein aMBF1 (putative translation factor)